MVLRLDPRYPLVWRDQLSLQIGAETPVVTLEHVSGPTERLIGALMAGISRSELDRLAVRLGIEESEVSSLVSQIGPALIPEPGPPPEASWIVEGAGPTAERVASLLTATGIPGLGSGDSQSPGLAIIIAHHVIDPRRYVRWLSRDIPHLAVVYTDTGVRVGPLVEPGNGPCLHCLARDTAERDPAWPAIASQLLGQATTSEREPLISVVAGLAARVTESRLNGRVNDLASATLSFDARSQSGRRAWHRQHPHCGCRSLSGIETAHVAVSHDRAARPTTERAASGLG